MERSAGGGRERHDPHPQAIEAFKTTKGRPTLIILDSHIGYGSPHKQDTPEAHGEPLGEDEIKLVKRAYGWPEDAKFLVPAGVYEHFAAGIGIRGASAREEWNRTLTERYKDQYPGVLPFRSTRCRGANFPTGGIRISLCFRPTQGHCRTGRFGQDVERFSSKRALVPRGRCRSRAVEQDFVHLPWSQELSGGRPMAR